MRFGRAAAWVLCLAAAGCAAGPPPPQPGTGTLWGTVRLVPREGVRPMSTSGGPYGSRRLRDVVPVDYSKPGFVVVYTDAEPAPPETARVTLIRSSYGLRFSPPQAAVGRGGTLVVRNGDSAAHTISVPEADFLRRLAAGEEASIDLQGAGAATVNALERDGAEATVFVAPGRFTVAGETGRWELRDLRPGRVKIQAWHPVFPGMNREVEVRAGEIATIDFEIGVGGLKNAGEDK